MRKIFACLGLFLLAYLLLVPIAVYAQGPEIPPTPKGPGGIVEFLGLRWKISGSSLRGFVEVGLNRFHSQQGGVNIF